MSPDQNIVSRFWSELIRRRVIYVITVYASASFVIIELVNNVLEPLNLPENLSTIVIIALAVAFPIVVILSWIFDLTPKGLEKTKAVDVGDEQTEEVAVSSNSWQIATYVSVVIIAGLILFNVFTRTGVSDTIIEYGKSIAVLPFINDSEDEDDRVFVKGTRLTIHNKLCMIQDLIVLSTTAMDQYNDTVIPVSEIAQKHAVSYVLKSSMLKYGYRILMNLELIDQHDRTVGSWQYEEEVQDMEELADLVSTIAQAVAQEIQAVITPEELERIEKAPTQNAMAFQLCQKGFQSFIQYLNYQNSDDLNRAKNFYEQALAYDSTYADAIVGLGNVYWQTPFSNRERYLDSILMYADRALSYDDQSELAYILRSRSFFPKADTSAEMDCYKKALDINPNLAVAYVFRANLYHFFYCDFLSAIKDYEAADLRKQGDLIDIEFYVLWAWAYRNAGFPELGRSVFQKAIPFGVDSAGYYYSLGEWESNLGNYEKAIEYKMKARRNDSTIIPYFWDFMIAGRSDEAYYWAKIFSEQRPGINHRLAYVLNEHGDTAKAGAMLRGVIDIFDNRPVDFRAGDFHFPLSEVFAYLGEKEKAYELLEKFIENRNSFYIDRLTTMRDSPMFDNLRGEERFEELLQTMETKWQQEHDRVEQWLREQGRI
jgi:tetratricopeptide (TPR) repeat protein